MPTQPKKKNPKKSPMTTQTTAPKPGKGTTLYMLPFDATQEEIASLVKKVKAG